MLKKQQQEIEFQIQQKLKGKKHLKEDGKHLHLLFSNHYLHQFLPKIFYFYTQKKKEKRKEKKINHFWLIIEINIIF